jgi:hypothetical protein
MITFEYKFELNIGDGFADDEDHTEEELNKLGSEGWELVAVSPCGKENSCLGYWFKRREGPS